MSEPVGRLCFAAGTSITGRGLSVEIIVCIKQVPDIADVKINPETKTLIRDAIVIL
jgi:hypothetical protein